MTRVLCTALSITFGIVNKIAGTRVIVYRYYINLSAFMQVFIYFLIK